MESAVNLTNNRYFERQKSTALLRRNHCRKITKSTVTKGLIERVAYSKFKCPKRGLVSEGVTKRGLNRHNKHGVCADCCSSGLANTTAVQCFCT